MADHDDSCSDDENGRLVYADYEGYCQAQPGTHTRSQKAECEETFEQCLKGKEGKVFLNKYSPLIAQCSIGNNISLRLESEYNRPYVYGIQLLVKNIIGTKKSHIRKFREQLCLMKVGMAHSSRSTIDRIDRITSKLNNTFKVRRRSKKAAKEVFQLRADPCDHRSIFDIEKHTRERIGIPLCRGLASHLQLTCIQEWVLTTTSHINELMGKRNGSRFINTSNLIRGYEKFKIINSEVPKRLICTERVICFKHDKKCTKYVNNHSQYLFSKKSYKKPKPKSDKHRQLCTHFSGLRNMRDRQRLKVVQRHKTDA